MSSRLAVNSSSNLASCDADKYVSHSYNKATSCVTRVYISRTHLMYTSMILYTSHVCLNYTYCMSHAHIACNTSHVHLSDRVYADHLKHASVHGEAVKPAAVASLQQVRNHDSSMVIHWLKSTTSWLGRRHQVHCMLHADTAAQHT